MATKINKRITHDYMVLKAMFDNGDDFTFRITRTRDSYSAGQKPATPKISQQDFTKITTWLKQGADENHMQRFERAVKMMEKARSLEALAMLVEVA